MPQAMARSRVYATLSRGFLYPASALLAAMAEYSAELRSAFRAVGMHVEFDGEIDEAEYQALFGGQVPACPPYETEYTAAHVWMQTQQMADVAGFYRAFGVDTTETGERADALTAELEFMYMLCVKEAIATEASDREDAAICRDAQAKFVSEHLAVWLPRFVARLEQAGADGYYPALARLTSQFVASEAGRFVREGA